MADTQADLLILLARPHSLWRRLFHRSITAEVLRRCPVPVLLVPVAAPDQPGWMPTMS
ncbi:universal stress protein [Hymenobacter jeollabukensis]|uniref:Universal stress protein n=1 Tax=Hymenobacter jeollabukensis TaxID=2025313 RepID=A0A5R8WJ95_9BACT|nr:universal stress protein [Hymenobacter jeollabukensis]